MRFATVILPALLSLLISLAVSAETAPESTAPALDTSCSSNLHTEAVNLWEASLMSYFKQQINVGLIEKGNTYVLYNTQGELQAFVEMTRRCKDRKQIGELVATLAPSLGKLETLPGNPQARAWVCHSGPICNDTNHLLGKEVQLNSAQYLGLLGALATSVVEVIPETERTSAEKAFLSQTMDAVASQLDRWLSSKYFATVNARAQMKPSDAVDRQSKYFFLDRDLWYIDSLSDLSELHLAHIPSASEEGSRAFKSLQQKKPQIAGLIDLFLSRVSFTGTGANQRAEIDRGYWSNYADSQYAAYKGDMSPVACNIDARAVVHKITRIEKSSSYKDPSLGWDFSHARRLVPALTTLSRNSKNLGIVFDYDNPALDAGKLTDAFANQITQKIWNKDANHPLFSNFWNGSNGWYRAGYENGTGQCRVGQAPYSLAWSFPTSGYLAWGNRNAKIRLLGVRLYQLIHSKDDSSAGFIKKYYSQLDTSLPKKPAIWMLSFLSSMVD